MLKQWRASGSWNCIFNVIVFYVTCFTILVPKNVSAFTGRNRMLELLHGHDGQFVEVLRLNKECFYRLCSLLTENGLQDTRSISAQEQVMMFLTIVGHCDSNRRSGYEWRHSGETVSRHFNNVCSVLVSLAPRLIGPPDFVHIPSVIENNPYYSPYFQDCIGAMDGTHVPCVVDAHLQPAFRNHFQMKFTYVVAGWEGSVHDARVLRDAERDPSFRFPHPPMGKDRRRQGGDPRNERFNYRHASLRNVVERTFGLWKNRFRILSGIPRYGVRKQRDIIIACAVLHNFIKMFADDAELFNAGEPQEGDEDNDQQVDPPVQEQDKDANAMGNFRDYVRNSIWNSEQ
ncbi:hypothetical protein UlMin_006545 [Ulmus minor]